MRTRDYQAGELIPGTVYRVLRLIGSGGMGTVYEVDDTTIGKRYVLKTLHPQLSARDDLVTRMRREARGLARLNHPNIVDVITAGVTADHLRLPYYVMERLSGQSLRLVLEKKGPLELAHAYHIGIDLLDALDHAHDKGIIHRDVKPDNIFLHRTSAGVTVTKLLDFGIVAVLDAGSSLTAGRFVGTFRYAAPEQLRGESPTAKTDLYAAALVIYEIVAGRGPFDDEGEAQQVGAAHMHKPPPPVSRFIAVPDELDALLMAALAKNPDARPRDAFSFAASLRNLGRAHGSSRESTENRSTAAAVVGPNPRASLVEVRAPRGAGPYVVSPVAMTAPPASAASTSSWSPSEPTHLPRTTLRGMVAPTQATSIGSRPADDAHPPSVATVADAIDRGAPTQTSALDTPRSPQLGTEAFDALGDPFDAPEADSYARAGGFDPTENAQPLPGAMVTPLTWPRVQPNAPSEEPHVRSLSAPGPSRLGPLQAVAIGVAGMLAVGALAGAPLVMRWAARSGPVVRPDPAPLVTRNLPPAPVSAVVPMASPTIAPPSLQEDVNPTATVPITPPVSSAASSSATAPTLLAAPVAAASVSAAAVGAPSGVASLHPRVVPIAPRTMKPVAASSARLDRPGPGF